MIVLPLNEEARSGRRTSWVTLAMAGVCVAAFLHLQPIDRRAEARVDALAEEAWAYFEKHPYVHVDEETAELLGETDVSQLRAAFAQELRRAGSPPIPSFVVQHDQVGFDRIVSRIDDSLADQSFHRWGFHPETLAAPDATLLSYALVHDDWLHLGANLAILIAAGLFLEAAWGRAIYVVFVLGATAAAAAGYAVLDPEGGSLGGASGLAAGLAGAFLVRFATTRIRFKLFYIPPFGSTFTARGWVVLPFYGALYLAIDHFLQNGAPGIDAPDTEFATAAHLAGLGFGALFAATMRLAGIEERFVHPRIEKKLTTRSNPVIDKALEARAAGRHEEAVEMLAGEVARNPKNPDASLAYWDAACEAGRPEVAVGAFARVLRDEVARGQRDLAIQHWRELVQRVPDHPLEGETEGRMGRFLVQAGEPDLAKFSMRRVLDGPCSNVTALVLQRLARVAADVDAGIAIEAARRALTSKGLSPGDRPELEDLVRDLDPGGADAALRATPARDERNERSGSAFGPTRDLGASLDPSLDPAIDPSERVLEEASGSPAPGVDEDGDTLNAPPFELDDADPLAAQSFDLGISGSGTPEIAAPQHAAGEVDAPAAYDPSEVSLPSGPGEASLPPGPGEVSLPSGPSEASLPPGPGEVSLPPLADPDDLDDLCLDDVASAEALDHTIDLADLGARTLPDVAADLEQTIDLAAIGARTLQPGELEVGTRVLPDPDAETVPDYAVTLNPALEGPVPVIELAPPAEEVTSPELVGSSPALPDAVLEPVGPGPVVAHTGPEPAGPDPVLAEAGPEPVGPGPVLAGAGPEPDTTAPELGTTGSPPSEPTDAPAEAAANLDTGAFDLDLGAAPAAAGQRTLKRMNAIPVSLGERSLTLDVGERGKAQLDLDRIEAVAVAGVRGLRPKPVVLIDLVTNWMAASDEPLKVVRVRSDRFDPRKLVGGEHTGFQALKLWIAKVVEQSGAIPLPDATAVAGSPFQTFESLEDYEREVLRAG